MSLTVRLHNESKAVQPVAQADDDGSDSEDKSEQECGITEEQFPTLSWSPEIGYSGDSPLVQIDRIESIQPE